MLLQRILLTVVLAVLSLPVFAKPTTTHAEVVLNSIFDVKANERSEDEIYLSVSAFYSDGRFDSYTIPGHNKPFAGYTASFPPSPPHQPLQYWQAKILHKVSDVVLWQGDLPLNQGVVLVVSVVEHDMPPWNLDDTIGTVKIILGNDKNKVNGDWVMMSADATAAKGKFKPQAPEKINLKSKEGDYQIKMSLK